MIENFRNPFFCVLWLILSLEKWLLGFWEQNLIFGVRFYVLRGPTAVFSIALIRDLEVIN